MRPLGVLIVPSSRLFPPGVPTRVRGAPHHSRAAARATGGARAKVAADPPLGRSSRTAQCGTTGHHLAGNQWRTVVASWLALADHADAQDYPEPEALRAIQAPTLILHGDRDWLFPVDVPLALYRLIPDAELCVLPQTGHGVLGERHEWFQSIVLDFLVRRAG